MSADRRTDEQKFQDALKRMLKTQPKPHKDKEAGRKPDAKGRPEQPAKKT